MIVYSKEIRGAPNNYNWSVRFDSDDDSGYLGISQEDQRILLTKKQVTELMAWVRKHHKEQR